MVMMFFPNNTDEEPFLDSDTYDDYALMCTSMISTELIVGKSFRMMYTDATCNHRSDCNYLDTLSQVCGDLMFVCPGERYAKALTKAGRKVYRYHMSHIPTATLLGPKWTKCNHGADLLFVFGYPFITSSETESTEDEIRMSIKTINYWANLAKTG